MFADHMTTYRFSRLSYKVCSSQQGFAYREHERSTSHVVKLDVIYNATKQYVKALKQAGHFDNPTHRTAALDFAAFIFNAHYHRILADLIGTDDTNELQRYQNIKAHILADHALEPLFSVYDTPSKLYERLAYLRPRLLRWIAYQGVKVIRQYRKARLDKHIHSINYS